MTNNIDLWQKNNKGFRRTALKYKNKETDKRTLNQFCLPQFFSQGTLRCLNHQLDFSLKDSNSGQTKGVSTITVQGHWRQIGHISVSSLEQRAYTAYMDTQRSATGFCVCFIKDRVYVCVGVKGVGVGVSGKHTAWVVSVWRHLCMKYVCTLGVRVAGAWMSLVAFSMIMAHNFNWTSCE